jgi:hypothetical protein
VAHRLQCPPRAPPRATADLCDHDHGGCPTRRTRARTILFDTYWSSKGWRERSERSVPPGDEAYAIKHGLMFKPVTLSHDKVLTATRTAAAALTLAQVRDAFLASLSTRRCDLRSGLATYVLARSLTPHRFASPDQVFCSTCGGWKSHKDEDLSVLNFERHKWGGVRHTQPLYQYLDLTALKRSLPATPEPGDIAIFHAILAAAASTPAKDGPGKLEKRLAKVVPGTKQERNTLLEILGLAGVLQPKQERSSPGDWGFVGMWRGADGYDAAAVKRLFGKYAPAARKRAR